MRMPSSALLEATRYDTTPYSPIDVRSNPRIPIAPIICVPTRRIVNSVLAASLSVPMVTLAVASSSPIAARNADSVAAGLPVVRAMTVSRLGRCAYG